MESMVYINKTISVVITVINIEHLLLPVMLDDVYVSHTLNFKMDNLFMAYCTLNTG